MQSLRKLLILNQILLTRLYIWERLFWSIVTIQLNCDSASMPSDDLGFIYDLLFCSPIENLSQSSIQFTFFTLYSVVLLISIGAISHQHIYAHTRSKAINCCGALFPNFVMFCIFFLLLTFNITHRHIQYITNCIYTEWQPIHWDKYMHTNLLMEKRFLDYINWVFMSLFSVVS